MVAVVSPPPRRRPAPVVPTLSPEQIRVLKVFEHIDGYHHPEDHCRGITNSLAVAKSLLPGGYLTRNPATLYFAITEAGRAHLKNIA